jgi:UDP-GlcNAc:undecaprenyl-phosphate GlcNAc-1-phosphate transferase
MDSNLVYLIDAVVLFILELLYFKLAERYKIIDKPNERSSHIHPTIRGGGIIFVFAIILFSIANYFGYPYLLLAVLLSGAVSFIDDLRDLPSSVRFATHLVAALLLLYQGGLFVLGPLWIAAIAVLIVAIINAYNFMDGINGITGFYSLAVIVPLLLSEGNAELKELETYTLIGIVIFLFFNARKRARCFAGDVGSVSMAVIVIFLLIERIYSTGNLNYICFLLLYGIDTGLTILQRLYEKENILKAHRKHLFQLGCNEFKIPHLAMAFTYGVLQLGVNLAIIKLPENKHLIFYLIPVTATLYILLKWKAYQAIKSKTDNYSSGAV